MTKKHFEAFASQIAADLRNNVATKEQAEYAANIVAAVANQFNSRFDRARFMKACGL